MQPTFPPTDRKPQATAGKHSQGPALGDSDRPATTENQVQVGMPFLAPVQPPLMLPLDLVRRSSFSGALSRSAQHCGKDDQTIADEIHISHGYMSRFMRGVAQQWARRLLAFMQQTNSLVPLQWLADQAGCDLTLRAARSARMAELQAEMDRLNAEQGIAA